MKRIGYIGGALFTLSLAFNTSVVIATDPCAPVDGVSNVSTTGPCFSIQAAIDAAPGTNSNPTVINVAAGYYTYTSSLTFSKGHIALRGAGRDNTTINIGNRSVNVGVWNSGKTVSDIEISGFTIENFGSWGISVNDADNVLIANNRLDGGYFNYSNPIYGYLGRRLVVSNNIMTGGYLGVYLEMMDNVVVSGNTISDFSFAGVYTWEVTGTVSENIMHTNGVPNSPIQNRSKGTVIVELGDMTVSNNEITDNYGSGIYVEGRNAANILSNTITGNGDEVYTFDLFLDGAETTAFVNSNVFDTIGGTGSISGGKNHKSDGTPW